MRHEGKKAQEKREEKQQDIKRGRRDTHGQVYDQQVSQAR